MANGFALSAFVRVASLGRLSGAEKGRALFVCGYYLSPRRWDAVAAALHRGSSEEPADPHIPDLSLSAAHYSREGHRNLTAHPLREERG
jgi:hypothetical protein